MSRLIDDLRAEPYVIPGALETGRMRVAWSPEGVALTLKDEDGAAQRCVYRGAQPAGLQVSASSAPRALSGLRRLVGLSGQRCWWHVELRLPEAGVRVGWRAAVDAAAVEGLPELDQGGDEVALRALRWLTATLRGLGARLTTWRPERVEDLRAPEAEVLVALRAYNMPHEAHLAHATLANEGIESFVFDAHTVSIDPAASFALGGVRLKVRARDARRAALILAAGEG